MTNAHNDPRGATVHCVHHWCTRLSKYHKSIVKHNVAVQKLCMLARRLEPSCCMCQCMECMEQVNVVEGKGWGGKGGVGWGRGGQIRLGKVGLSGASTHYIYISFWAWSTNMAQLGLAPTISQARGLSGLAAAVLLPCWDHQLPKFPHKMQQSLQWHHWISMREFS